MALQNKTIFLPSWMRYWLKHINCFEWPGYKIYYDLARKFLSKYELVDPIAYKAIKDRPCLYLANHQTFVESIIFIGMISAIGDRITFGLSKIEHKTSWVGQLAQLCFSYPGIDDIGLLEYFDRDKTTDFSVILNILKTRMLEKKHSLLIHVEGTRRRCSLQDSVKFISPVWINLAIHNGIPIVPVRFIGGLPTEDRGAKFDFPVDYGSQMIRIGTPILPEVLAQIPEENRRNFIRNSINTLINPSEVNPEPANKNFADSVTRWVAYTGVHQNVAVIFETINMFEPVFDLKTDDSPYHSEDFIEALVIAGRLGVSQGFDVSLIVPNSILGEWMYKFATYLYGQKGPKVYFSNDYPQKTGTRVYVKNIESQSVSASS